MSGFANGCQLIKFQLQTKVWTCPAVSVEAEAQAACVWKAFLWSEQQGEYSTLLGAPRRCGRSSCGVNAQSGYYARPEWDKPGAVSGSRSSGQWACLRRWEDEPQTLT